jgi:hypothetical protein
MARPQFSDFRERKKPIDNWRNRAREREKLTADVFVFFFVNRGMKQKKTGNLRVELRYKRRDDIKVHDVY